MRASIVDTHPRMGITDKLIWKPSQKGYTVKSTHFLPQKIKRNFATSSSATPEDIWKRKIFKNLRKFIWRNLQDLLAVG